VGSKGLFSSGLFSTIIARFVLPPLFKSVQSRAKVLAREWIMRWSLDYIGKTWPNRLATAEAILKA
jgi:hypothetical protein